MRNYEVGYGKPPKHSQFKKGVCPNPHGRGKSRELRQSDIAKDVLNAEVEFRDHGKLKKASRMEVLIKQLVAKAIKGDVASAADLLKVARHAEKYGEVVPTIIEVYNGLPLIDWEKRLAEDERRRAAEAARKARSSSRSGEQDRS